MRKFKSYREHHVIAVEGVSRAAKLQGGFAINLR